jgi:hypothetical protein
LWLLLLLLLLSLCGQLVLMCVRGLTVGLLQLPVLLLLQTLLLHPHPCKLLL